MFIRVSKKEGLEKVHRNEKHPELEESGEGSFGKESFVVVLKR